MVKTAKKSPYFEDEKGVGDILGYDLKVLFVGINPGVTSTERGHHFAGPTNHFWPCLSESGLCDRTVHYYDDNKLPDEFRLGITNLTARTTRSASELSLSEQRKGIPVLTEKIKNYRPRVACFVGKGIYEIYSKGKCKLGLQENTIPWTHDEQHGETLLFVMPSTSGIVSAYQKSDKLK
jgi:TDG/mug DNA glycosylase family protein